ncbi:pirin family protein [Maribacter litopenaei]|uniref:Pirin family protein n=1 Tax=Maribacter litopenaei TaxID=2976127 RepID=A0ABY5Y5K8_9FLAO|nr:pirin family protein [Maribacter litopenaei]UWX53627.1 pirin family protein [Maribacter litopenaei]
MTNNQILVDEKPADIGQFTVGRLLPIRKKRQVGPFTFIDHMGPTTLGNGIYMDVDQHPHTGLSTLTYLFEGEIAHKDSTGADQLITPGDVGFMTSGKAVTHTERTPKHLRTESEFTMHGYQVWVAIPKELEDMEPNFQFIPKEDVPTWEEGDTKYTLVAGEGYGRKSPLKVYSPLFMLKIESPEEKTIKINGELEGEIAIVVVTGSVYENDTEIKAGQMLISKTEDHCDIHVTKNTQLLLFGGKPLGQEHYLIWNFVSSDREKLKRQKQDWIDKKFPKVPGDDTYIPFPEMRLK